jgi:hypothetical protein
VSNVTYFFSKCLSDIDIGKTASLA